MSNGGVDALLSDKGGYALEIATLSAGLYSGPVSMNLDDGAAVRTVQIPSTINVLCPKRNAAKIGLSEIRASGAKPSSVGGGKSAALKV